MPRKKSEGLPELQEKIEKERVAEPGKKERGRQLGEVLKGAKAKEEKARIEKRRKELERLALEEARIEKRKKELAREAIEEPEEIEAGDEDIVESMSEEDADWAEREEEGKRLLEEFDEEKKARAEEFEAGLEDFEAKWFKMGEAMDESPEKFAKEHKKYIEKMDEKDLQQERFEQEVRAIESIKSEMNELPKTYKEEFPDPGLAENFVKEREGLRMDEMELAQIADKLKSGFNYDVGKGKIGRWMKKFSIRRKKDPEETAEFERLQKAYDEGMRYYKMSKKNFDKKFEKIRNRIESGHAFTYALGDRGSSLKGVGIGLQK